LAESREILDRVDPVLNFIATIWAMSANTLCMNLLLILAIGIFTGLFFDELTWVIAVAFGTAVVLFSWRMAK
jgi:hypothetical protein